MSVFHCHSSDLKDSSRRLKNERSLIGLGCILALLKTILYLTYLFPYTSYFFFFSLTIAFILARSKRSVSLKYGKGCFWYDHNYC